MKSITKYSLLLIVVSIFLVVFIPESLFGNSDVNTSLILYASNGPNNLNWYHYIVFSAFGVGIGGTLFGLLQSGSNQLKSHNAYLEKLVKDRTKILELKHQQLANQNDNYKEALEVIQEQKEELEITQSDLVYKNTELKEALEEIQCQNELIDRERSKLEQAKKIIQDQNTKLLTIVRDLDKEVQSRTEELYESNKLLKAKNKELDDFIYKSAHDLRGPVARFKGLSHLIYLEYSKGNDIADHLDHLFQSAEQMDQMLRRLSNVYEISSRPISHIRISVKDLMDTVFSRLNQEENLDDVELELHQNFDEDLITDPTLTHLLLKNLLGNAVRFRDPRKKDKNIQLYLQKDDQYLKIRIEDNGIGIAQDHHKKIFDLFYVGSEYPLGPGLGLYVCKLIMRKLKGTLRLEKSELGKGSVFEAKIPLNAS